MATKSARAGVTLLELTVAMMVLTIIFMSVFALWELGVSSFDTAEAQTVVNQELRKAMDCLIMEVMEAGVGTITDVPADDAWYPTFTFRTVADVVSGAAVLSADTVRYSLGGADGKQFVRTSGGNVRVVANDILAFRARRSPVQPWVVEFLLWTLNDPVSALKVDSRIQFKVKMRN